MCLDIHMHCNENTALLPWVLSPFLPLSLLPPDTSGYPPSLPLHLKLAPRLRPHLIQRHPLLQIHQRQAPIRPVHIEGAELGDDLADGARAGEQQSALLEDLGRAVLRGVLGEDDDLGVA